MVHSLHVLLRATVQLGINSQLINLAQICSILVWDVIKIGLVIFQIENKVFRLERYQIAAKTLLRGATLELEHRCAYMYICRNLFNNNFSHKNAIHNSTKHEIS